MKDIILIAIDKKGSTMDKDLIKKYNEDANHLVARVMRYVIILIFIVGLASSFKIFTIRRSIMEFIVLFSLICLLIPTLIFDVMKKSEPWAQYLVLGIVTLYSGLLYSFLSYHVVIIFIFPYLLASVYYKKNYFIFVSVLMLPTLTISHIIALQLQIVPDEPLVTFGGVIKYGILPRSIEIGCCAIICMAISKKIHRLIVEILSHSKNQQKQNEVLHQMIEGSENLLSSRTYQEATINIVKSIHDVLKIVLGNEEHLDFEAGYCLDYDKKTFYLLYIEEENQTEDTCIITPQYRIFHELDWTLNENKKIVYHDDSCLMQFYYKDKLLGFVKYRIEEEINNQQLIDILHIAYNNAEKIMANIEINFHMVETQKRLVHSLAMISESKSEQTGQHIYRVGEYMRVIGHELGLNEHECDVLSLAAMLHDVGKMAIPSEILDKPGKLTKEEFEIIKSHVVVGQKLLHGCPGEMMELGKEIAYQHHEKWDGTGYLKKKGDEINVYATYVAVIDVFDALISKRSYKEAWTPEDAYQEIIQSSGTHFSPKAVEVFKKVYPKLLLIAAKFPDCDDYEQ